MQDYSTKTSVIRYFILCACVVGLYYVVTSETVAEAILNFCFAGVVPGTDRALAPDTVMIGVAAAAGVLILAIAARIGWRLLRSRQRAVASPQVDADGHTVMFSRSTPVVPIKKQLKPANIAKPSMSHRPAAATVPKVAFMGRLSNQINGLILYIGTLVVGLRSGVVRMFKIVPPALEWLGRAVFVAAENVADSSRRAGGTIKCYTTIAAGHLYVAGRNVRLQTKLFLRWVEPYARRFDTWLEMRCRHIISFSKRRLIKFESVQIARSIAVDAKKSLKRLAK